MANVQITSGDIDNLARKLDELGEVLTDNERAILLAVFGMAATSLTNAVQQSQTESGVDLTGRIATADTMLVELQASRLPPLSAGFKDAFTPGRAGSFKLSGLSPLEDSIDVSVGGVTVSVGWSKDLKLEGDIRDPRTTPALDRLGRSNLGNVAGTPLFRR